MTSNRKIFLHKFHYKPPKTRNLFFHHISGVEMVCMGPLILVAPQQRFNIWKDNSCHIGFIGLKFYFSWGRYQKYFFVNKSIGSIYCPIGKKMSTNHLFDQKNGVNRFKCRCTSHVYLLPISLLL